jgi:hypothetical protein
MRADRFELPLRIVMEDPFPGVAITLQRGGPGKEENIPAAAASPAELVFEFDVIVDGEVAGGGPRFLGPFVHGPPTARFVYLRVGRAAGQPDTEWNRRVKIPLKAIGWAQIRALKPGERLSARIGSRARDGGPACATVPLLGGGWTAQA